MRRRSRSRQRCEWWSRVLLALALIALLLARTTWTVAGVEAKRRPTNHVPAGLTIVVLADGVDPIAAARTLGVKPTYVYTAVFSGFAAKLPASAMTAAARRAAQVKDFLPDAPVHSAAQVTPTGVERIAAEQNPIWQAQHQSGVDADVAVLDTGVATQADLNVEQGKACVGKKSTTDNDGHGTHVAGIIGAKDNDIGVVGVAPGARLWAVKVLDGKGNGTQASVVCGLDWVYQHRTTIDVVNLSLSGEGRDGPCDQNAMHKAICRVTAAGIPVVVAAGNERQDASNEVPAAWAEAIAVAALADSDGEPGGLGPDTCAGDPDDTFAFFSNFGPAVDIVAPGECIRSLTPDGGTRLLSGTSQASPHVAGALALYKAAHPDASAEAARQWLLADASRPQDSPQGIDPTSEPGAVQAPVLYLGA
jgi:subtilisin family serine protease